MKPIVKLPKGYYEYQNMDISKLDNQTEDQVLSISLTAFVSCRLEQYAMLEHEPVQTVLKRILIDEGVLNDADITISGKKKNNSKFDGVSCDDLKGIGTTKLHRITMSEQAKAKVFNRMVDEGIDLTFFIKRALIEGRSRKKPYHILKVEELDK